MRDEQLSMLEVAESLMLQKKKPQQIKSLIKEVMELKGLNEDDFDQMAQLYNDITTSAKFVYCGEDTWDLKERQSLELWDKDGAYFNTGEEVEEDEEDDLTLDDYTLVEEEEEDDEDEEEEEEIPLDIADDEDGGWDDDEEENYNAMMDDYEDLYDK